jgi:hypothetical protein
MLDVPNAIDKGRYGDLQSSLANSTGSTPAT